MSVFCDKACLGKSQISILDHRDGTEACPGKEQIPILDHRNGTGAISNERFRKKTGRLLQKKPLRSDMAE
jgi:hypothetical protein